MSRKNIVDIRNRFLNICIITEFLFSWFNYFEDGVLIGVTGTYPACLGENQFLITSSKTKFHSIKFPVSLAIHCCPQHLSIG